ncbi:IclR family transcriptional regulator [Leucothrix sargassi]|nr:IclR family transcriptional regulator [Leucothrix sargassi]
MAKAAGVKTENSGLTRGLMVVSAIADSRTPMRFADLQAALDVPKATLHRILGSLQTEGMVRFSESSQTYSVGYRLLELANMAWKQSDVRELAYPSMLDLAEVTGESVQLAVMVDANAVYLSQVESEQSVRYSVGVGDKSPLYCSGVGKALLAAMPADQQREFVGSLEFKRYTQQTITSPVLLMRQLKEIAKSGLAFDVEEHQHGIRCVAAAIVDTAGFPVAAISVTAPTFRVTDSDFEDWGKRVAKAAQAIAQRLQPEINMSVEVK